jgi:hypothetical protein
VVVIRQLDRTLMDREALAQWTHRSVRVIRQHCVPAARGLRGKALYDADAALLVLDQVPQRHRMPQAA